MQDENIHEAMSSPPIAFGPAHGSFGRATLLELSDRLADLAQGDSSVSDYANELRTIRTSILAIDSKLVLSKRLMVLTFLHGLGPNFRTFEENIMASRDERPLNIPLEDLIQQAIEEEACQQKEDEKDQRNEDFTTLRGPANGKIVVEVDYCDHCEIPCHSTANCFKLHLELETEQDRKRKRN